jgi:hypothetical protein
MVSQVDLAKRCVAQESKRKLSAVAVELGGHAAVGAAVDLERDRPKPLPKSSQEADAADTYLRKSHQSDAIRLHQSQASSIAMMRLAVSAGSLRLGLVAQVRIRRQSSVDPSMGYCVAR